MQKSIFLIRTAALAVLALHMILGPLHAEEAISPEAQAEALQNIYSSLTSLSFDFSQVTRTGGRERTGRGNAVFYKGHVSASVAANKGNQVKTISIMRWNYTEPDKQVIINDGETLSIYTEKDRQLIKTPARELESDITYAFFAGTRKLLDDFEAQPADNRVVYSSGGDLQTILLVPRKPHNQIKTVQVWFNEMSIIRHLRIEDHFDAVTELNFDNIALNNLPPDDREQMESIISFQIPPGTEIITQ